jgi:hypothetical protein
MLFFHSIPLNILLEIIPGAKSYNTVCVEYFCMEIYSIGLTLFDRKCRNIYTVRCTVKIDSTYRPNLFPVFPTKINLSYTKFDHFRNSFKLLHGKTLRKKYISKSSCRNLARCAVFLFD